VARFTLLRSHSECLALAFRNFISSIAHESCRRPSLITPMYRYGGKRYGRTRDRPRSAYARESWRGTGGSHSCALGERRACCSSRLGYRRLSPSTDSRRPAQFSGWRFRSMRWGDSRVRRAGMMTRVWSVPKQQGQLQGASASRGVAFMIDRSVPSVFRVYRRRIVSGIPGGAVFARGDAAVPAEYVVMPVELTTHSLSCS